MATMMYPTLTKSQSMRSKRKSAVELLAESKPFYVKSEIVRDTTQAIPTRVVPIPPGAYLGQGCFQTLGGYTRSKSVSVTNSTAHGTSYRPTTLPQYMAVSPSRSLPPLSHRRSVHSGSNDLLQNKLRQLLVCDSAEELSVEQLAPLSPPAEYAQRCHKSLPDLHCRAEPSSNKSSNKSLSNRDSGGSSGHYTQRSEPAPPPRQVVVKETRRDSGSSTQHSGTSSYYCCQEPECRITNRHHQPVIIAPPSFAVASVAPIPPPTSYAPPPIIPQVAAAVVVSAAPTFKRQKCLRYKRDRPILRSKSDISDRYWRPPDLLHHHPHPQQQQQQQPLVQAVLAAVASAPSTNPTSHLEQFFEHLGLTSDCYEEMLSRGSSSGDDSPVFFSDVSTVDSSKPIDSAMDYCTQGGQQVQQGFRPSEPPSIVERNARIIKWLCNCRKSQLT